MGTRELRGRRRKGGGGGGEQRPDGSEERMEGKVRDQGAEDAGEGAGGCRKRGARGGGGFARPGDMSSERTREVEERTAAFPERLSDRAQRDLGPNKEGAVLESRTCGGKKKCCERKKNPPQKSVTHIYSLLHSALTDHFITRRQHVAKAKLSIRM